jgi:A/G-specific adenine glycosylase
MTFCDNILAWYENEKRDLPWRNSTDPYVIWVSEIILQQTRVAQGLPYFNRFVDQFPDVFSLANADEALVLSNWQGLGYYRRAQNMHKAAKIIVRDFDGVFPSDYNQILALPGIGLYAAAAISSIAFGLPYSAIDGNVNRVMSRFLGITTLPSLRFNQMRIKDFLTSSMKGTNSGQFNQAMMELGAVCCLPRNPNCESCPIAVNCVAFATGQQTLIPISAKRVKAKEVYLVRFVIQRNNHLLMYKRGNNGIWSGMWDLPGTIFDDINSYNSVVLGNEFESDIGHFTWEGRPHVVRHLLTHRILHVSFIEVQFQGEIPSQYQWVNRTELSEFALPRLISRYLET